MKIPKNMNHKPTVTANLSGLLYRYANEFLSTFLQNVVMRDTNVLNLH